MIRQLSKSKNQQNRVTDLIRKFNNMGTQNEPPKPDTQQKPAKSEKAFELNLTRRTELSDNFHGSSEFETFEGKQWRKVNSNVNFANNANTLWVSVGSSHDREKILFNVQSPIINTLKNKIAFLARGKDIQQTLMLVNEVINQLTDVPGKTRKEIERTLNERLAVFIKIKMLQSGGISSPFVTMDELIKGKLLICRHKALLAACLIGHLIDMGILPKGKARVYRSFLKSDSNSVEAAHTWGIYRDNKGRLWICDPRWGKVILITDLLTDPEKLKNSGYGIAALNDMVKRLNQQDGLSSEVVFRDPMIFSQKIDLPRIPIEIENSQKFRKVQIRDWALIGPDTFPAGVKEKRHPR